MPWVNYHSHSDFCDGKAAPEMFIQEAIRKGFRAYGCSSHAPVSFPSHWNMPLERLGEYLNDIASLRIKYADRIQVYTGLEIDYIKENPIAEYLKGLNLDYRIGSIHYLDILPDGTHFSLGSKPDGFFRNIGLMYQNDFKKAIKRYYHQVRQMVLQDAPDIIGHMDKIKEHNSVKRYMDEQDGWYVREVEDTLDVIASTQCIVEVNTRGLYRHDPPQLYPSPWILKRVRDRQIPVIINSDAHHPSEIENGMDEAAKILVESGFETVRTMLDGTWCDVPVGRDGLQL